MRLTLDIQLHGATARAAFLKDLNSLCAKHGRVEGRIHTEHDITLDLTLISLDQPSLTPIEQAIYELEGRE